LSAKELILFGLIMRGYYVFEQADDAQSTLEEFT